MKKQHRIFQKFLLFVLVFWASLLNAQQYPVQVTPVLLPPYSLRLGDYATTSENKLQLQLLMKDLMEPSHRIKIRFSLESGVNSTTVVQNNPFINGFQEITLYPGTPILLTNIDLRPLFQLENLTGINAVNYARPLPEGMYKFCFQVFDSGTGRALSAKSAAIAYLVQYEPPILNLPQQGEKVLKPGEFQNIVFQWMPRQMAPNTKYIFTLKELWDTQRDPVSGFLSSRIFCQEETYAPTLYYGMDKTALIPGKRYAWQIQAKSGNPVVGNSATEDNGVYKNNGLSEIFYFDYTENCIVPIMLTAKNVGRGKTEIRWSMTGNSSGSLYRIQYRRKGSTAEWVRQESYQDMCILTGLKDETEYEYRVGSVCGNLYQTDNTSVITGSNATDNAYAFSEVQTFITDNKETSNSNIQCGILPQVNISNKSPLQTALGTNEVFIAGDFPVTVLQSQGTSGTYTGYGYIEVPYLADTKIKVTFSNIQLNTDKQLIGGILETTYDVNEGNIIKGSDIVETFADFWEGIKELSYDLYDKIREEQHFNEAVNDFINNITDYIKDNQDISEEQKQEILAVFNDQKFKDDFTKGLKELKEKIEKEGIDKEEFADALKSNLMAATEGEKVDDIDPELQEIINRIETHILSIGENGCAFVRKKLSGSQSSEINIEQGVKVSHTEVKSIDYLVGEHSNNNVSFNIVLKDIVTERKRGIPLLLNNSIENVILYIEDGEIKVCVPQEDYRSYTDLETAKDDPAFLAQFLKDLSNCKDKESSGGTDGIDEKYIFETLRKLQSYARANQEIEFLYNGIAYILEDGQVRISSLSDEDVDAGKWEDKNIDLKIRFGFDENGILQIEALGLRNDKNLIAEGKVANLSEISQGMKEKGNKFFERLEVKSTDQTPADKGMILDSDAFPDGKKIDIDEDASTVKILCEAGGIAVSFLKTTEVEQPVYLANEEYTVKVPSLGTGSLEAGGRAVTDITSMVSFAYNIVVDEDVRKETVKGFSAIKEEIKDDPASLFPLLGEIILEEFSGNTSEEWREANSDQTDNGRQSHLLTKGTVRTVASVFASGKFLAKVPDMADNLAKKMAKIKNLGKYDWRTVRRYFIHIQEVTGRPILQKQIDKLKDALRNKEYRKLTPEEYQAHKRQYTSARREKMIKEWEENTGQTWPVDENGNRYQLHHIIEEQYGGEHEWWNAHPAKFPDEHQGGIHGTSSPSRELFK